MKKTIWLPLLLTGLTLACGSSAAPTPPPTKTVDTPSTDTPADRPEGADPVRVRLHRDGGAFLGQVAAEAANASRAGLTPFLEFDADW